jgi:hypothetical protein
MQGAAKASVRPATARKHALKFTNWSPDAAHLLRSTGPLCKLPVERLSPALAPAPRCQEFGLASKQPVVFAVFAFFAVMILAACKWS